MFDQIVPERAVEDDKWTPYGAKFAFRDLADATLKSLDGDSLMRQWWQFRVVEDGKWHVIERKQRA